MLVCFSLSAAAAFTEIDREQRIKAAFLFNFAKFIDWPEQRHDQGFQVCTIGSDPLNSAIQLISGKQLRGEEIIVQQLSEADDISSCRMLYMSKLKASQAASIFYKAQKNGIVTVGDGEQFARNGGVIGFTRKAIGDTVSGRTRIGFAVNVDAARKSGVKVRSELLKLATIVRGSP